MKRRAVFEGTYIVLPAKPYGAYEEWERGGVVSFSLSPGMVNAPGNISHNVSR